MSRFRTQVHLFHAKPFQLPPDRKSRVALDDLSFFPEALLLFAQDPLR